MFNKWLRAFRIQKHMKTTWFFQYVHQKGSKNTCFTLFFTFWIQKQRKTKRKACTDLPPWTASSFSRGIRHLKAYDS